MYTTLQDDLEHAWICFKHMRVQASAVTHSTTSTFVTLCQGAQIFHKVYTPPQKSMRQKGAMKQVRYWGTENIRLQRTKFSYHGDRRPRYVHHCIKTQRRGQNHSTAWLPNLWHACPKWHAEDFLATRNLMLSQLLLPDPRLYIVKNMCLCVCIHYTHIWHRTDCV